MNNIILAAAVFTLVSLADAVPQPQPLPPHVAGLEPVLQTLTSVLGGQLQKHIQAALAGEKLTFEAPAPLNLDLDGPALPSRVQINASLNDIYHFGIGDIVPDIDVDLIRLSLRANYKLPSFRLQGGYSIQILSNFKPEESGSRDWLVLTGESDSTATVSFTNLELDVVAKLKWTLLGGFKVDTLDYTLSPFEFDVRFPNLRVLEGLVDVSDIINPVLSRMFKKELWDMENDYHEPLVTAIRDFIDWLLRVCPVQAYN